MENILLCKICNKRPIFIKKWEMCEACYRMAYRKGQLKIEKMGYKDKSSPTINKLEHEGEISFVNNYFKGREYLYHPVLFHLNGLRYTPDFYDPINNTFIEVSATRQAYHANKTKFELLKKYFPKINFEIRKPSGKIIDPNDDRLNWK